MLICGMLVQGLLPAEKLDAASLARYIHEPPVPHMPVRNGAAQMQLGPQNPSGPAGGCSNPAPAQQPQARLRSGPLDRSSGQPSSGLSYELPLQAAEPRRDVTKDLLGALLGLVPDEIAAAEAAAGTAQTAKPLLPQQAPVGMARAPAGMAGSALGSSRAVMMGQKVEEADGGAAQQGADRVVWLVWAEANGERMSPSLLLAYALLTSRRDPALFLRMATGLGFAQARRPSMSVNYLIFTDCTPDAAVQPIACCGSSACPRGFARAAFAGILPPAAE
jgi:hypothetical protein